MESGIYNIEPTTLSLEAMRDTLFANGWRYIEDEEVEKFRRSYARVNAALEHSTGWRIIVLDFRSALREWTPQVRGGLAIGMSATETEVTVELCNDQDDWHEVAQVYVLDAYLREKGFEEIDEAKLAGWTILKGEPGAPRPKTKAYYEQHPRAATLRAVCLRLIENYVAVAVSEDIEGEAMNRLLELNQELAQLAIVPDMHADARPVDFADPVKRAERIAGILRQALQEGQGFVGSAQAIISEHNILTEKGGDTQLIESSDTQAAAAAYFLMKLGGLAKHLAAETE